MARGTSTMGASVVPMTEPKKFWVIPAFKPRRFSAVTAARIARQIGRNGPSTAPITSRAANNVQNEVASPDSTEHSENTTSAPSRNGLRAPLRSDQKPIR